ncbi:MAG: stimulus-sensing domain-containing protein, partial [Alphaproteobacteria bacterium]|nr:stimulus-sensing domain-containing protein [Alphaproteobacteria bacterium]
MLDKVKTADAADGFESEDQGSAVIDEPPSKSRRSLGWWRFVPKRLASRIVLLNLLGLVILVSGILYSNQFRQGLIDARVQSLTTQAQIIAAAVAGSATVDTGSIVIDPDELAGSTDDTLPDTDQLSGLDFPINPETAGPILRRLLANTTVRARIIDKDGNLVVDSRYLYSRGDIFQSELPPLIATEDGFLTRMWNHVLDYFFTYDYPVHIEYGLDNGRDFPEIAAALNGATVSVVRLNERRQIIVLVSVPVQRFRAVLGALVLSTTGGEIDDVLRAERRVVFMTFGFVALVTILLSVLLASTIALPLRKLARAAERVRSGINKRVEIPDFSSRHDEIGDLSGAVRDMTSALYRRIDAIEAFAADVSHELKNPLTSLRSAVETLPLAKNDEQRQRLTDIVKHDVKRLDRLISDISDASRLDAELARTEYQPVDMAQLVKAIMQYANDTRKENQAEIVMDKVWLPQGVEPDGAFRVLGHDSRLGQVVRNLVDNARSFTRPGSKLHLGLRHTGDEIEVRVDDSGP